MEAFHRIALWEFLNFELLTIRSIRNCESEPIKLKLTISSPDSLWTPEKSTKKYFKGTKNDEICKGSYNPKVMMKFVDVSAPASQSSFFGQDDATRRTLFIRMMQPDELFS